jgi:hypothetical protein
LKNGFDSKLLYQIVFTAKDPYILGVGFAAFRDVGTFFRYAKQDDIGTANPLMDGGIVRWAISRGRSQSGNFLRGFLHFGFNQDEAGKQVYDGAWPIIAGRRIGMNFRWAQPDGVLELYQAGSEGPQWWVPWPDKVRGLPARSILDRCMASKTCPKIIEHFRFRRSVGTQAHTGMGGQPAPTRIFRCRPMYAVTTYQAPHTAAAQAASIPVWPVPHYRRPIARATIMGSRRSPQIRCRTTRLTTPYVLTFAIG